MSSYDGRKPEPPYPVDSDYEERIAELEAERDEAYKKGMERAAEIVDELYNTYATNEAKDIAELQAQAIRKEIEK